MTTLKQRLEDLIKEKKARAAARNVGLIYQAPISKKGTAPKKESLGSWKEKRERWIKYREAHLGLEAPAGEIANMIDGLTPDGYDKRGRKVSFVETGKGLTGRSSRISSDRPLYISKR